jgi:hypothetical protein
MAKWVNSEVLDFGLDRIKQQATRMVLISSYTLGDSAATINANTLAYVNPMSAADYTLGDSGSNRTLTVASGKTAVATANAPGSPDLHIAFTDGTTTATKVFWVTDETSNQAIVSGNTINFPSGLVFTSNQPTP